MSLVAYSPNRYVGNGATAQYPYTFKILAATDLRVIRVNLSDQETVLQLGVDFSVTGVGQPTGGNITLLAGNLTTDFKLIIKRIRPLTQTTSIRNQSEYYASTHEDAFDKLAMLIQQVNEQAQRSLVLAESMDPAVFDPTLPAALEAERMLMIAPNGLGFALGPTPDELANASDDADAAEAAATAAAAAQAAAEEAAEQAQEIADSIVAVVTAGPFPITEGQSATELDGESHDSGIHTMVDYVARIRRGANVYSRTEFSKIFRDGTWELVLGNDRYSESSASHGVTFSVDASTGLISAAVAGDGEGNGSIDLTKYAWPA